MVNYDSMIVFTKAFLFVCLFPWMRIKNVGKGDAMTQRCLTGP